jgi:pimeloyl-ACP methyl ester carboxylesterase
MTADFLATDPPSADALAGGTPASTAGPGRLAVVGHSAGGFAALMTAAGDPAVHAVVSLFTFDFGAATVAMVGDPAARAECVRSGNGELSPPRGTSGEALVAEMEAAGPAWSLAGLAPKLVDRAVLLMGTSRDPVTPADVYHWPLVEAYRAQPVDRLEQRVARSRSGSPSGHQGKRASSGWAGARWTSAAA